MKGTEDAANQKGHPMRVPGKKQSILAACLYARKETPAVNPILA